MNVLKSSMSQHREPRPPALPHSGAVTNSQQRVAWLPWVSIFLFCKVEEELIKIPFSPKILFSASPEPHCERFSLPTLSGDELPQCEVEQMGWAGSYCEVRGGECFGPGSLSLPKALSLSLWEWSPCHRVTRNVKLLSSGTRSQHSPGKV